MDLICMEERKDDNESENEEFYVQTKTNDVVNNENDYELIENVISKNDDNMNSQCTGSNEKNDDVFSNDSENFDKVKRMPTESKKRRMSKREKKRVQKYCNPEQYCIYVNYVYGNVPNNYNEAINSEDDIRTLWT